MSTAFIGRKILLVEDDQKIRQMFARYLSAHGFLAEETDTFAAALKSFEAIRPDIAVLDFKLPDGTALDLVPKLKELAPSIPIIVLTGFGSMDIGGSLSQPGGQQCPAKPIQPRAVLL